ncbi:hypothetical protein EDC01DRAFT_789857 [Geopyxis carbonaria]|nr:hypothetical protein EDC01DRAFT_789857 [Geopyxis carbonaria]
MSSPLAPNPDVNQMRFYIFRENSQEADFPRFEPAGVRCILTLAPILDCSSEQRRAIVEYERVRLQILEILEQTDAGPSWCMLLATIQSDPQPALGTPFIVPTIMIYCNNLQRCYHELAKADTYLRIEVRKGGIAFNVGTRESPFNYWYNEIAGPGRSIGVEGVKSSGTLGAYVHNKATYEIYGVTTAHVTMMHLHETNDRLPITLLENDQVKMVSNSDQDHDKELMDSKNLLDSAIKKDEDFGGICPRRAKIRANAQAHYQSVLQSDRSLGMVQYSQLSIVDTPQTGGKSWKDVGLVEIRDDRMGNSVCGFGTAEATNTTVTGHAPITPGMKVMKAIGRTTSAGAGLVNGTPADCRILCPHLTSSPAFSTREWVVLPERPAGHPFSDAGDSGCAILTRREFHECAVVAIVVAGAKVDCEEGGEGEGEIVSWEERIRSGRNSDGSPGYGGSVAIVTPAEEVLRYLARDLGAEFEFGI